MSSKPTITKPMTPAVEAISKLHITGNVIPHVWYQRKEFRTAANRPDRDMITTLADVIYWYRAREVRDEENGGIFVGYERKFTRDQLQYDYFRRAAIFGMTKRQMQEACGRLARVGLVKLEYRTEVHKGKAYSNIVYVEPIAEAVAATLVGPNVEVTERVKGAPRGMHARKADAQTPAYNPDAGVDDQIPGEGGDGDEGEADTEFTGAPTLPDPSQREEGVSQNSGTGGEEGLSQNSGTPLPQNSGGERPKFWDTYHESSSEISLSRDFIHPSNPEGGNEDLTPGMDDGSSAVAGTPEGSPDQAALEGGEDLPLSENDEAQVDGTKLEPATGTEDVPAAAAPAGGSAILALTPVPRAELAAREPRDPVTNLLLRALMSCSSKSPKRLQHMHDQLAQLTPSGLPREWFCRLTDEELEQARAAAQTDAHIAKGQMGGAGYYALEPHIGEPLTFARLTGKGSEPTTQAPLGRAYEVTNTGRAPAPSTEPEPDRPADTIEPGTRWEHKKIQDKIVTIVDIDGGKVELHTGETLLSYMLTRDYKRVN